MDETREQILAAGASGEEIEISGIIVPGDLDKNFQVVSILLSAEHELELTIEQNAQGVELFEHLRESVWVRGQIRSGEDGGRTIWITEYRFL